MSALPATATPSPWTGLRTSLEADGEVWTVRLFNDNNGLMDDFMEQELLQLLDLIDASPGVRTVILTGRDSGVFVRHFDVGILAARARALAARDKRFSVDRPVAQGGIHMAIERIAASPVIFLAAVNGTAMGGGWELALGCDLRIVQDGPHELGLPELNLGLLPGAGGTQFLARLLGPARALELALTARVLRPHEAVLERLALACVPDALAHARQVSQQLLRVPAKACAHIKQLIRQGVHLEHDRALAIERTLFCDCLVDPEALPLMDAVARGERTISQAP